MRSPDADDDLAQPNTWRRGYWLATVYSPRIVHQDGSRGLHMVVMRDRELVWDPHPDREQGHLGFVSGTYLVPLDPARFDYRAAA